MLRFNTIMLQSLPSLLGYNTASEFCNDWGHDHSTWVRINTRGFISISLLIELCNRWHVDPTSFFYKVENYPTMNVPIASMLFVREDAPDYKLAFSLRGKIIMQNGESIKWMRLLDYSAFSYGKKARMLNPDPQACSMTTADIVDICNANEGITPYMFFHNEHKQNLKIQEIDELIARLQSIRSTI